MGSKLVWGELDSPADLFSSFLLRVCSCPIIQIQTILDLVAHCFQALPLLRVHVGGQIVLIFGVQFSPENDHQCSLLTVGFFVCFSSEPSVLRVWPLAVWAGCAGCVCTRALSPSSVRLLVTPWTAACQAALSMGCPRQERWCGLLFPPPGALPVPGVGSASPALQADSLPAEPPGTPQVRAVRVRLMMGSSWNHGRKPGGPATFHAVTLAARLSCPHFSHLSTSWSMMGCSAGHSFALPWLELRFLLGKTLFQTSEDTKAFEFPFLLMF